jgi:hypothetical protein
MQSQHDQFIGMYKNVFPDGYCNHIIQEFEYLLNKGMCGTRQQTEGGINKTRKDDTSFYISGSNHHLKLFNQQDTRSLFFDGLQSCYNEYTENYSSIKDSSLNITCSNMKIQKTNPGQGYHLWHFEQGAEQMTSRILTYMCYLNTITEAGETEYLYQKLRIPPQENTMVLWPAAYTHTHRGNVVHGTIPKYVITGWFHLE